MQNAEIAAVLEEIADLLEVDNANPFRVRAYRNAARIVSTWGRSVQGMVEQGEDLDAMPGIGPDLAGKIGEIVRSGSCALLRQLHKSLPPAVAELLKIPGLGPKRVSALRQALRVGSVEQLHRAAEEGRIDSVPGFGAKLEQQILDATTDRLGRERRVLRSFAAPIALALLEQLRRLPGVERAEIAGSLRRQRDTIGDLDLLASSAQPAAVVSQFAKLPGVRRVLVQGDTKGSVVLASGLQADLRVVDAASFGAAWVYLTGSKAHNIALRKLAQEHQLKLNEYGVFRGTERIADASEESVYRALGLAWMAPELREDRGEVEAARRGELPTLIEPADLRGDLHVHSHDSDGRDSLEALVAAAQRRGWEYLAITDHSRRLAVSRGLDAVRLAQQIDRIDRFNQSLPGFTVLKGVEVDILEDGSLDLPDSTLARLDIVIGAVHQRLNLSRAKQTERLLRAMDNRFFDILAHPSGRLIDHREGSDFDLPRVLRHARQRGCFVELNAQPQRLDLVDTACRMAKDEGVLVAINSDAHAAAEFVQIAWGIGQARRGWLEQGDVLNTRPLAALRKLLRAR